MMTSLGTAALWLLTGYLTAYVLYQAVLFAANALVADPRAFRPSRRRRFNVFIPAHNEEMYLARLLESLQAQDYPAESYRVTVIADNCSDQTVSVARRFGADVLERTHASLKGKGHAIRFALEHVDLGQFDAIAIVDGDSQVGDAFLSELNLQLERGDRAIQCYNAVANPGQSWFTRLMDVSRTMANDIIHPAKRKLGLSSHLMGNGMCFDTSLLSEHGWNAFSVGEDWEYYARLVLAGSYVGYCRGARVYHQESVNLRQASSQRLRWSSGRFEVLRRYVPSLVLHGLRARSLRSLDAALPLLFPNPSLGINLTALGLGLALIHGLLTGSSTWLLWYALLSLAQLVMFLIGAFHTRDRAASAASIVLAPLFLGWKLGIDILSLAGAGRKEWTRTERRAS